MIAENTDLDTIRKGGKYWFYTKLVNAPFSVTETKVGVMDVLPSSYGCVQKMYLRSGEIYERCENSSHTWDAWQRIDNYGTSSLSELASALGVADLDYDYIIDNQNNDITISGCCMATINSSSGGGLSLYIFNYHSYQEIGTAGTKDFTVQALGSNRFKITKTTSNVSIRIRKYGIN